MEENPGGDERSMMVTWVLVQEPTIEVAHMIEVLESRIGTDPDEVTWMCADFPVESIQD